MEESGDIVGEVDRRGSTAEERIAQAQERIRFCERKHELARANKHRIDTADCESKITYWSTRLRSLEERMALG